MIKKILFFVIILLNFALADWPEKSVNLITAFPAGGSTDQVARSTSLFLSDKFKIPFIVENKSGATGTIATNYVVNSKPDGYTLLVTSLGPLVIAPHLYKNLKYDALKDLDYLIIAVTSPNLLVVPADSPHKNINDVIKFMQNNPNKMTFASSGAGSSDHLTAELFWLQTKTKGIHVPYKGGSPAHADLIGSQVDASFQNISSVSSYLRSGKIRALAIVSYKRNNLFPEIPTLEESGIHGLGEVGGWQAIVAPKGLDENLKEKISKAFIEALNDQKIKEFFINIGFDIVANSPEEFTKFQKEEFKKWQKVIKDGQISIEN